MHAVPRGRILLMGGTGTLGRAVAARLAQVGADYLMTSRWPGPKRYAVDLRTPDGVAEAVRGTDVVINCATDPGHDVEMTRALLDEAERARVGHVVHVSIVGIDQVPLAYYREKVVVESIFAQSAVPHTILRATQFHDLLVGLFRKLAKTPLFVVPGETDFQPVDVTDVAGRLVELAAAPPAGRVADFGGPRISSAADLAQAWLVGTGRHRRVVPIRMPGRLAAAARRGALTVPDHAEGTITFSEFLARQTHSGNR